MPSIDRDGVAIHYDVAGSGPATPVLLTHGFAATGAVHAATVTALGPERRCLTWDIRGHGRSESPPDPDQYSVALTIGDMAAILDAEGIDRAVSVGHSLGGYLSLAFQLVHPDRVAALVLVGTGPGYRNDDARAAWNDMCESFARSLETKGFDGLRGGVEVRAGAHRSAEGLAHAARGILRQHDATVIEHLPDIDVPTLVVTGEHDAQFLTSASYLATKIPGGRSIVIEGAGHAPMLTHPSAFDAEVGGFLHDVDASAATG